MHWLRLAHTSVFIFKYRSYYPIGLTLTYPSRVRQLNLCLHVHAQQCENFFPSLVRFSNWLLFNQLLLTNFPGTPVSNVRLVAQSALQNCVDV